MSSFVIIGVLIPVGFSNTCVSWVNIVAGTLVVHGTSKTYVV